MYPFSAPGLLCEGGQCSYDIQIPVADNFNSDYPVKCMQLEQLPLGNVAVFKPVFQDSWTVQPLRSENPDYVTCTVDRMGEYSFAVSARQTVCS